MKLQTNSTLVRERSLEPQLKWVRLERLSLKTSSGVTRFSLEILPRILQLSHFKLDKGS